MTPRFDWTAYYAAVGVAPGLTSTSRSRSSSRSSTASSAQTRLADWKTYLKWQLLDSAAPSLSDAFVDEDFAFNGAYLNGAKEIKPRWKRCAESTDRPARRGSRTKYVEKYFPPEAKARMQELVKNLRLAMKETIEGLDWMSAETKAKRASRSSRRSIRRSAIPTPGRTTARSRSRGRPTGDDVVAGREFNVDDDLATIGKPVDRGRWGMTPPTSNAYYNPLLNEIVFPAGILQPPAFSVDASDAVNYGAIGVVIGHEISHGFDDEGAQYDAQGRLQNWWSEEDLEEVPGEDPPASSSSTTATRSSPASRRRASSSSASRSGTSPARGSPTGPSRSLRRESPRCRTSGASRRISSSSSPGASSAATRSGRSSRARWRRAIRTRSASSASSARCRTCRSSRRPSGASRVADGAPGRQALRSLVVAYADDRA